MANPVVVELNQWEWTKVATSVISGAINRLREKYTYYQCYRMTGDTAPAAITREEKPEEAFKMFENSSQEPIKATHYIDVYVLCTNNDTRIIAPGKVRVDV